MALSNAKIATVVASATAAVGLLAYLLSQKRLKDNKNKPAKEVTQKLYLVGIDLGATNAKAGIVRATDGVLLASASIPLEAKDPSAVVASLMVCVNCVCAEADVALGEVAAVGIGSPGHVFNGVVKAAANFKAWKDVPLAALLQQELGGNIPVRLVNDADAALAAECWVGAASSQGDAGSQGAASAAPPRDVVMVTLGSGVGVAVLVAGSILQGSRGLIEGGHSIVHLDHGHKSSGSRTAAAARLCGCGHWGCAEAYISANSVRARFHEACEIGKGKGQETPPSREIEQQQLPVPDTALSTARIFALAFDTGKQSEDNALAHTAVAIVDETARILALFLVNLCRFYDCQVVLLGGGMAEAGEPFLAEVRRHFEKTRWTILPDHVKIRQAKLGSDAGIVGAAAVVREFVAGN